MKKIFLFAAVLFSLNGIGQQRNTTGNNTIPTIADGGVPSSLITGESTWWTISTVSTVGYVNTTPGASYNSYKSGGGMIVQFKFYNNIRFDFLLYVQANTYGTDTETWTQVTGTVSFSRDAKGRQVFTTKAEKGSYRVTKNGSTNSRPIPWNELNTQHSNTYLWERTNFADDPGNTYLLMVDVDAHPGADINQPGTIDPSWVSKFHIPNTK